MSAFDPNQTSARNAARSGAAGDDPANISVALPIVLRAERVPYQFRG
jgi:hypothetical protein